MKLKKLQGWILASAELDQELACLSAGAGYDPDATRVKWRSWEEWPSEEFEVECPQQTGGYLRGRRKAEEFVILSR